MGLQPSHTADDGKCSGSGKAARLPVDRERTSEQRTKIGSVNRSGGSYQKRLLKTGRNIVGQKEK